MEILGVRKLTVLTITDLSFITVEWLIRAHCCLLINTLLLLQVLHTKPHDDDERQGWGPETHQGHLGGAPPPHSSDPPGPTHKSM